MLPFEAELSSKCLAQYQQQYRAIGMETSARRGLRFPHRIAGREMRRPCGGAGVSETGREVFAFLIDIRIDLVGEAVVALVALEADVVSCRADPYRFAID